MSIRRLPVAVPACHNVRTQSPKSRRFDRLSLPMHRPSESGGRFGDLRFDSRQASFPPCIMRPRSMKWAMRKHRGQGSKTQGIHADGTAVHHRGGSNHSFVRRTRLSELRREQPRGHAYERLGHGAESRPQRGGTAWLDGNRLQFCRWRSGGAGTIVETNDLSQFQFLARGSVAGTAPTFEVRLNKCTGDQGRDVSVNGAGRIAVVRVSCL
jgi:hypothetical protein